MNRQTFELLILGSSSATPTSDRQLSGQLLNISERLFLIDCGEATQIQLRRLKARFQTIGHIFISHLHGDHYFGLPGLLSSMHLLGRKTDLHVYCPAPLQEIMELINHAADTRFNYKIHWHHTNPDVKQLLFEDDKVAVYSFPLRHRIACTGFLFCEKPLLRKIRKDLLSELKISVADIHRLKQGFDVENVDGKLIRNADVTEDPPAPRNYAYCSDTAYFPELCEYIRGADLLYHESTFLESHAERAKATYHSTARQAGSIARMAGVKQLLLGHYSTRYPVIDAFLTEATAEFPSCSLATDGKLVKI